MEGDFIEFSFELIVFFVNGKVILSVETFFGSSEEILNCSAVDLDVVVGEETGITVVAFDHFKGLVID